MKTFNLIENDDRVKVQIVSEAEARGIKKDNEIADKFGWPYEDGDSILASAITEQQAREINSTLLTKNLALNCPDLSSNVACCVWLIKQALTRNGYRLREGERPKLLMPLGLDDAKLKNQGREMLQAQWDTAIPLDRIVLKIEKCRDLGLSTMKLKHKSIIKRWLRMLARKFPNNYQLGSATRELASLTDPKDYIKAKGL